MFVGFWEAVFFESGMCFDVLAVQQTFFSTRRKSFERQWARGLPGQLPLNAQSGRAEELH
jgi:hypothetical protein